MKHIYTEIFIQAPPAVVWRVLTDLRNYESWNPFIIKAEGTLEEGRSVRGWVQMMPGHMRWVSKYRFKTLRLKHDREWSWLGRFLNIPWLIDGEQSYRLVPEREGTRILQTQHLTGILLPFFGPWLTVPQLIKGTELMLTALKRTAERNTTTPSEVPVPVHFGRQDSAALQRLAGSWALITGASSGIGREFSRQLAVAGLNLVLVARRKQVLEDWGAELVRDYKVQTRSVAVDLMQEGAVESVHRTLQTEGIRIRLLCNVAGVASWGYFEDTSLDAYHAMMRLNAEAPVEFCHLFRDDLASHLTSAVINVSSPVGMQALPYMAVYSATKAFLLNFSQALYGEWIWQGTLVQTLMAEPTATNLSSLKLLRAEGFFKKVTSPVEVVRQSLEHLGSRSPVVKAGHRSILHRLFSLFPSRIVILTLAQRFRPPRTGPLTPDGVPPEGVPSPEIPSVSCPLCGHKAIPPNPRNLGTVQGNTERFRETTFHLWKCPQCLTIQALDDVDFAEIYRDYPLKQRTLDLFARKTYANLLQRLKRLGLRKTDSILDYGCGNGVFLHFLREKGYDRVRGYDPYDADYAVPPAPEESFDWVVACDVIEHVADPRGMMRDAYAYVKPGGVLYVGTCDAEPVDMQDLEKEITRLHQPFHRFLVSEGQLKRLALETGGTLAASYQRSYLDTLWPMVNYRFLDEACQAFGRSMDDALDPWSQRLLYFQPKLWFFGFFGYFFPSAKEPAVLLRKTPMNPVGSLRRTS